MMLRLNSKRGKNLDYLTSWSSGGKCVLVESLAMGSAPTILSRDLLGAEIGGKKLRFVIRSELEQANMCGAKISYCVNDFLAGHKIFKSRNERLFIC